MADQTKQQEAVRLLCEMQALLHQQGEKRYPQRSDFAPQQVANIKAALGPWGRALEAAGLKPPREDTRHHKTLEKRLRTKANQNTGASRQTNKNGGNQP
ncbi:MAG: hypothetical protein ACI4J3_07655 [Oscillospiraceae bacterium]